MNNNQFPAPPDLSKLANNDIEKNIQIPKTISQVSNSSLAANHTNFSRIAIIVFVLIVGIIVSLFANNNFIKNRPTINGRVKDSTSYNKTSENNITNNLDTNSISSMIHVTSGDNHSCGIYTNNQVYCWGDGANGQLGAGEKFQSSTSPIALSTATVLADKTIKQISAGSNHTCAIASDNNIYCWGMGNNGQMGNGYAIRDNYIPEVVYILGTLKDKTPIYISSIDDYSCILASDNHTYCWGAGIFGTDNNNELIIKLSPTLVK